MKITKPTCLIDKEQVLKNIERLSKKAGKSSTRFRPHFKTHQSAEIGDWHRQFGVKEISVSSLDMAEYFAEQGWKDISVCIPVNVLQTDQIAKLAKSINLHLLVESPESVQHLGKQIKEPVNIWIEIDSGSFRSGIHYSLEESVVSLIEKIEQYDQLIFQGLLTHSGHTYQARSKEQVVSIHKEVSMHLFALKQKIKSKISPNCQLSIGDTPISSVLEEFEPEIDEIRPGNYVFYDVTQCMIGSCDEEDVAAATICPIIAKYPERGELIVYGGAVHLSKEYLLNDAKQQIFGWVAPYTQGERWGQKYNDVFVSGLSQEHGKISAPADFIDEVNIGDLLAILPIHSCLSANLMSGLRLLNGQSVQCFRY